MSEVRLKSLEGLRVVGVALSRDGQVLSLPAPARHFDLVRQFGSVERPVRQDEQGFLLSNGKWCSRRAAMMVAKQAGQILPGRELHPSGKLFSEDVW